MSTPYTPEDIALIRDNHIKAYANWYTKRNNEKVAGFEWLYGKPKEENEEVK